MELASNQFIQPAAKPSPVLTMVEPAATADVLRKLGPDDVARVFKLRLARLGRAPDAALSTLLRDQSIATAVDVLGMNGAEVGRLNGLSRARVCTIMAQIRAEAGA